MDTNTLFPNGLYVQSPLLNIETVHDYAKGWDVELKHAKKQHPLTIQLDVLYTPHIQFSTAHYSAPFLMRGASPKNCLFFSYIQTQGVINFQNKNFHTYELIVTTDRDEIDLVLSQKNNIYTLAIEKNYFSKQFFHYFGKPFEEVIKHKTIKLYQNMHHAFLHFLYSYNSFFTDTFFITNLEDEIIQAFFGFLDVETGQKKSNFLLKQAREYIEQSLLYNYKLTELAQNLDISQRTLEYNFQHALGMSPKNYMQLLKLHKIRQEILSAAKNRHNIKISDLARKYNYFHMGHFTAEYKKLFSQTPSETLHS